MAPKKKAGKSDDPAKFVDKENLKRAEAEILSLQRLLEVRSNEALEARRSERMWRDRMAAISQALEQQKEDTLDITSDMLRQYKAMQEQMVKRISVLENDKVDLQKKVEDKESEIGKLKGEKEQLKRSTDLEILGLRKRMEEMQQEFADMLREALSKMHQRLEASHSSQLS